MSKAKKKTAKKTVKKRAVKKTASATKKAAKKKVAKKTGVKKKAAKKTTKAKTVKRTKKRPAQKATSRPATRKAPVKKKVASQARSSASAPQAEVPVVPASPPDILLALAKLLLDDAKYHDEVRLAVESPQDYVDTFAEELALRGITEAVPSLPWIALTDGLARHDALVQLDWKFEPDDLTDAFDQLSIDPRAREQLLGMVGYSTPQEGLAAAGDRLLATGLALITVDNNEVEDSFPLAVLSASDVPQAQRLASELGLGSIRQWSSAG